MGAKGSKQNTQRTDARKNVIQRQIENLTKFTTNVSSAMVNSLQSKSNDLSDEKDRYRSFSNQRVKRDEVEILDKIATNAKKQLERDTKPMTKADLIAILVRLRATKENLKQEDVQTMIAECNKYTVGELNGIIRCAVFDFTYLTDNDVSKIKDIEKIMLTIEN